MSLRSAIVALLFALSVIPFGFAAKPKDSGGSDVAVESESSIDFRRDVRPILSDHCFSCHGPDEAERQADLRLDTADDFDRVIDVDDVDSSELLIRITHADADLVMPPPEYHKPLQEKQKQTLRQWIQQGAEFRSHWAFEPLPSKKNGQSIDTFIQRKLDEQGLIPNPRESAMPLMRRVTLDLTGLPPTRQQIEDYRNDSREDRYERYVESLMQSPDFGRHFGRHWLDLVRYGDTHGLHLDNYREMWPYRDWVIDSINANMPFDEFVTRQLAGDLLPDATEFDRIASGFNRLNVTTSEGGSIYDEVFARNCIDRTDAFGTIFLGLTTQCAVCHDHKFDPISQKDYYSLLAFFNSLDGRALDGNKKDHPPVMRVPTEDQNKQMDSLQTEVNELSERLTSEIPEVDQAQAEWEAVLNQANEPKQITLIPEAVTTRSGAKPIIDTDGTIRFSPEDVAAKDVITVVASLPAGTKWRTVQLESIPDGEGEKKTVGLSDNGNVVLSEIEIALRHPKKTTDENSKTEPLDDNRVDAESLEIIDALANIEQEGDQFAIANVIDGKIDGQSGWAVAGHLQPGERTAWFKTLGLHSESDDCKVEFKLHFESVYAKHQFKNLRFTLSDAPPSVPPEKQIQLSSFYRIGPFELESESAGYYRAVVKNSGPAKTKEVVAYEGKEFRWEEDKEWVPVQTYRRQLIEDRSSQTTFYQKITTKTAAKISLLFGADDGYLITLNNKQLYRHDQAGNLTPLGKRIELPLRAGENHLYIRLIDHGGKGRISYAYVSPRVAIPASLETLAQQPAAQRNDQDNAAIRTYYRTVVCDHPIYVGLRSQRDATRKQMDTLQTQMATTLVWKELEKPRQAFVLNRGQYDQPGDKVSRNVPEFLPPLDENEPKNRLGLARWLLRPDHPLTARVAVNRYWQILFGTGIVKTSEDFGSQGEPPSHPKLLDDLATDFIRSGWDVKAIVKQLVTSEAYRRDRRVTPGMLALDPENRFYARGPRHRMDAEVLRDQSLALSGLLSDQFGGPSVKPPQPSGLWAAVGYTDSDTANFVADQGEKTLRRSVYTFWKRTSAPPVMSTLDAPTRESCTARRERTNTPLQALLMMNETQFLAAAAGLAKRSWDETESDEPEAVIAWMFETVTAESIDEKTLAELSTLYRDLYKYYQAQPELITALAESIDLESMTLPSSAAEEAEKWIQTAEDAAMLMVASTMLNLDRVVNQ